MNGTIMKIVGEDALRQNVQETKEYVSRHSDKHTIVDYGGNEMPARGKLQFLSATVEDDEANDTTIVTPSGGGGTTIVQVPEVTIGEYTYNGTEQSPAISTYDPSKIIVREGSATDAGDYTLTLSLANTSTMIWTDMTTADKTYPWSIAKKVLDIPTVNGSFTYDGGEKEATISAFDDNEIAQGGMAKATDADTYTVTFDLANTNNLIWSDNTTSQKSGTWMIGKATPTLEISKTAISFNANSLTDSFAITKTGDGTVSVVSSNSNIASANLNGMTVNVAGNTSYGGTATITVSLTETKNYSAPSDKVCTVTATYAPTKVAFGTGTDAQISEMIDYAREHSDYKLSDAWAVGNVRTIKVSAFTGGGSVSHAEQDIDIVITSFEDYENCGALMQFDFKDELATGNRMNSSNTNSGGYDSSEMFTTTLPALVNALPSWLKSRLKTFSVKAGQGGGSTSVETISNNKLALRSEWEVFGTKSYADAGANGAEASGAKQISYYATSSNRVKKRGHTGSAGGWWLRSPYSSTVFCLVYSNGNAYNTSASNTGGVAPFGCI